MVLLGCRGNGSSAPAPTNVNVVAGDTSVTISWDMSPGVDYWVFKAAAANITPLSCYGMPQCQMIMHAVSPLLVTGLTNGTTYSFTINGRIDGGAGGPGSPSRQATPRLAGATWSVGSALVTGAYDLRGVAYGSVFIAAAALHGGAQGALFSSPDGISWTALTNPVPPSTNLYAATYYNGNYMVVGAGGVILSSPDAVTWTQQTSVATNNLYAVTSNGAGGYVATGASGTIIYSGNGINWTAASPTNIPPSTLNGVTYGNGMYVAVGASGTLLTSTDGNIWSPPASISSSISSINLKTVAYGPGIFVALGDNGTLVTSTDGINWTLQSPIPSASLINAVTYGRQFIAVADDGSIFASIDGLAWTLATSASSPLYAVIHGPYDYSAVGFGGLNMHAK